MKRSHHPVTFAAILSVAAALLFASSADAQVRIGSFGGVSIRAPFVDVGYGGFGGFGYRGFGYNDFGYRAAPIYGYRGYDFRGYGYPGYGYGYGYNSYVRPYASRSLAITVPIPVPVYPDPYTVAPDYVYTQPLPADAPEYYSARPSVESYQPSTSTGSLEDDLRIAADRLARSLSARRDDADVWMDYLKPDLIIDTIDRGGSPAELQSLLLNYEGLTGNSHLSAIWVSDGFRQTHRLLRQWVETTPKTNAAAPNVSAEDFGGSIYDDPYADREPTPAEPIERAKPADRDDVETLPRPAATKPKPVDL